MQGAQVQSLVRKLRSHMPPSVAKKKKKLLRQECGRWTRLRVASQEAVGSRLGKVNHTEQRAMTLGSSGST